MFFGNQDGMSVMLLVSLHSTLTLFDLEAFSHVHPHWIGCGQVVATGGTARLQKSSEIEAHEMLII